MKIHAIRYNLFFCLKFFTLQVLSLVRTRSRIGLKNPAFSLMSSEGRDRTKQIQKQEFYIPWSVQVVEFIGRIILKHGALKGREHYARKFNSSLFIHIPLQ